MPTAGQVKFAESVRRAKARLSNMNTQEVSLVDNAANKRRFVIVKRDGVMSDKKPVAKDGLRLPSEAKQGIMDGLSQVLDKVTALATMVGEAETDDQAAVPDDLGLALNQCAELLEGLATQYGSPPTDEQAPPAGDQAPDAAASPPPPDAAGKSATEEKDAETKKDLPGPKSDANFNTPQDHGGDMTEQHHGFDMSKAVGGLAEAMSIAAKLIADEATETAKAGRKIKGSRYQKLTELHGALGKLLNELAFDDASEAAEAKTAGKNPTKKDAPAPVAKAAPKTSDEKLDKLLDLTEKNAAKLKEHDAAIAKMGRQPAESRTQDVTEGNGAPQKKVVWPLDMSADLQERKRAAKS